MKTNNMEWISVEDELPESSLEFICHHNGNVFSAVFDDREQVWFIPSISHKVSFCVEVSDWMPLPEPPSQ